ncbi:mandelate racemase/muconate lactonizing enzyme family protein [Achromobacter sp. GD03932]|uniref:mandelate racemase/muconate lactonizing enzyme family protein n=1 Tax=Achromobacter sp. GD03932 TaxID=2975407 RepID=UPI002449BD04|nr:mandelate racemase/muconate lactonizing enzyme family protein [Achromobacter sp. GD03932]MDH1303046.1 mandelate racemase/muconate lactonizing enzyme family protein [Achromobacter sp. GD03932]
MTNPNTNQAWAIEPFTLARIQAYVLRWPVKRPVQTSFGTMHDRPALLVRVEDADGAVGWGEVWCNFPGCGAEHRARLLETVVAPLVVGQSYASAEAAFAHMSARTAVLAIQSGEPGPIAQVIAGIDLALWDMLSRRAGAPLWQFLGGASDVIRVYASGINPDRPEDTVLAKHAEGYRAFKLKVGFGEERDLANVRTVRARLPSGSELMLDANQAWDLAGALHMSNRFSEFTPRWLEEPLRADRPLSDWAQLAEKTDIPLAAGENLIGSDAFEAMINSRTLKVVQPDLAKWGGISGCLPVIDRIHEAGLRYCPHFLGAGVGQLASAHILAARGRAGGMLEIDANENPLRAALSPALGAIVEGEAQLGNAAGLGVQPDIAQLRDICGVRS